MHQGWPKFVQNLWYATADKGLAALVYGPSTVTAKVAGGIEARLTEDTFYPFEETIRIKVDFTAKKVKEAEFPVYLRIPLWCRGAEVRVDGEPVTCTDGPGDTVRLNRTWKKGSVITLSLPMTVMTESWYDDATVVTRGPLVYALKLDDNWTRKEFTGEERAKFGATYYEVTTASPWNYAFSLTALQEMPFEVIVRPSDGRYPWNVQNAPVSIRTTAVVLPDWKAFGGVVGPVAYYNEMGNDSGEKSEITLIPYGCTTLRICEFPTRR